MLWVLGGGVDGACGGGGGCVGGVWQPDITAMAMTAVTQAHGFKSFMASESYPGVPGGRR
ncbi:MAG: hypothetical protein AMJ59_00910 [Gammaproteobacteria bacterium SG8_31]|nr:MAG: hypothetical protein AMJ59_00910 [Gammaproteobacteria bacterium SG8_31]